MNPVSESIVPSCLVSLGSIFFASNMSIQNFIIDFKIFPEDLNIERKVIIGKYDKYDKYIYLIYIYI